MVARDALARAFAGVAHNEDDGTWIADRALEVLRELDAEDRMEAMGMERRRFARPGLGASEWTEMVVYVEPSAP